MPIGKKKGMYTPYLAAGVIVIVVPLIILLISLPPPPATPAPQPCLYCVPTPATGLVSITGVRDGTTILVTITGQSGLADVSNFTVRLNGVPHPVTLAATPGSSVRVNTAGPTNSDHLIVVANYRNGAQYVVLDKLV